MLAMMAVSAAAAGCGRGADAVRVDQAWVRLSPVPGRPAAGYLRIRGGGAPVRMVAIDAPAAGSTELHESMGAGGHAMMTMRRLDGIEVPRHGEVKLAPGGRHLMLFGVDPKLGPGDRLALTVRFAKGPPVAVEAKAVGAGDAAPF